MDVCEDTGNLISTAYNFSSDLAQPVVSAVSLSFIIINFQLKCALSISLIPIVSRSHCVCVCVFLLTCTPELIKLISNLRLGMLDYLDDNDDSVCVCMLSIKQCIVLCGVSL